MPITSLLLILGSEIFVDFEVPEQIREIGGSQVVAQHDFPGGIRTQHVYGAFPALIEWSGIFTGTGALARMRQVDRLRVAGQEVALSYGGTTLLGIVSEFHGRPMHQWRVPYTIRFMPRVDLSCISPLDELFSSFSLIQSAVTTLTNIAAVIAAPGSTGATHAAGDTSFQEFYVPLPPTLAAPITALTADTLSALQAALGLVADISPGDAAQIYADAQAVQAIAQPLSLSADPTVASPALDVLGYVGAIVYSVKNPSGQNLNTVYAINPNLFQMAAQYYGDATQWQMIANASGISPPDPMPIGSFVLTIPNMAH